MLSCLTLAFALAAPVAPAADDPKAVVEKAVKAHGGAVLLNKFKAHKSTFHGTVSAMGMDIEMSGESFALLPDKAKVKGVLKVGGQEVPLEQVLNGKKFTMSVGGNVLPVPEEQVTDGLHGLYAASLSQLTPLLDPAYTLKPAGRADVEGKPAVGVLVSHADRPDVTLYFDADTGRLVKTARKGRAEDGSEAQKETLHLDYKAVEGLQVPHRERGLTGGKQTEDIRLDSYTPLETLPADMFGGD